MEKYFVIEITKTKDGEVFAKAITEKDTPNEAEALYHQILSSALVNPNIEYAQVRVEDISGNTMFARTINYLPTPEPNEEEE